MKLHARHALLPEGWARDVGIEVDDGGFIVAVAAGADAADAERIDGWLVPGMPNLHSHAFQRAMAGLAEVRTHPEDSFWTWRELMYRFAARITPEQLHDVAAWLYVEMLKAGFTSVAEFHYLHHDAAGRAFDDAAEMSHRIVDAARSAGIALTHLPVLYQYAGFGAKPARPGQERFLLSPERHVRLVEALQRSYGDAADVRVGAAFHSLRAVDPAAIVPSTAALRALDATLPIHIHVAEQRREVEECIAWSGQRPVQWLLEHVHPDAHWCLVHATHLDAREIAGIATSGAVAGLCPTTEANLGDGLFPADAYLGGPQPGRFGIGTDSHVQVSVASELRLLEYGQRLSLGRRAVLASHAHASPGARIFTDATSGGARALGIEAGRIAPGTRADLVVLDADHPALSPMSPEHVLDAWIFAGDSSCVRDVMVGGAWRIRDRRHAHEEELARRYRAARAALSA
jgi:formimidoylglutamate deiminase